MVLTAQSFLHAVTGERTDLEVWTPYVEYKTTFFVALSLKNTTHKGTEKSGQERLNIV